MKVHTRRNARVFGHSACISVSFVCMPVALGVLQFLFDICSSPPVEQVSQESTTCSLAETGAKETPPPPPPLRCQHAYTHTHLHKLHLLSGAALDEAAEGDRVFMRESVCVWRERKRERERSQANVRIRTVSWTILYPRPAGCQEEAAIDKST